MREGNGMREGMREGNERWEWETGMRDGNEAPSLPSLKSLLRLAPVRFIRRNIHRNIRRNMGWNRLGIHRGYGELMAARRPLSWERGMREGKMRGEGESRESGWREGKERVGSAPTISSYVRGY
jgi:hypothetical protein